MIERYEVTLHLASEDDPLLDSPARGALMHGLLMKAVANDRLHANDGGVRPFTQHLARLSPGRYLWTINILNVKQAKPLERWLTGLSGALRIEHYDVSMAVADAQRSRQVSYEELLCSAMEEAAPRSGTYQLVTPLIFKRANQSLVTSFPETRLIVQSILKRWNHFTSTTRFDDAQILEQVASSTQIVHFNLRSRRVAMDGINIVGSLGSFTLRSSESHTLRRLLHLCGLYSEYCGIGAKTAMGLGAVSYQPLLSDQPAWQKRYIPEFTNA